MYICLTNSLNISGSLNVKKIRTTALKQDRQPQQQIKLHRATPIVQLVKFLYYGIHRFIVIFSQEASGSHPQPV
jgi:hypothetical protein